MTRLFALTPWGCGALTCWVSPPWRTGRQEEEAHAFRRPFRCGSKAKWSWDGGVSREIRSLPVTGCKGHSPPVGRGRAGQSPGSLLSLPPGRPSEAPLCCPLFLTQLQGWESAPSALLAPRPNPHPWPGPPPSAGPARLQSLSSGPSRSSSNTEGAPPPAAQALEPRCSSPWMLLHPAESSSLPPLPCPFPLLPPSL